MPDFPQHGTKEWSEGRLEIETSGDDATAEELDHFNVWTSFWSFVDTITECLKEGSDWQWWQNSRCKYINIRVDMRTGHCRVTDQDGKRITANDIKHQYETETT